MVEPSICEHIEHLPLLLFTLGYQYLLLSLSLDLNRLGYFFRNCPCFGYGQKHLLEYAKLSKLKYLWLQQEP